MTDPSGALDPDDPLFWRRGEIAGVRFGFTDARLDLGRGDTAPERAARERAGAALGARCTVAMHQVHGRDVATVDGPLDPWPEADALVTRTPGVGLLVRVADCTPIVLIDTRRPGVAVVHAGRDGLVRGVLQAAVEALGGSGLRAVVGPRVCGRCYELPGALADAVDHSIPGTRTTTSWGTPAVDVGAGVVSVLADLGVEVDDLGAETCTLEDERFSSHRRDAAAAGRMGAIAVLTETRGAAA